MMNVSVTQALFEMVVSQAADKAPGGVLASLVSFAPFVLMLVVVYFLMIRPANKQRREHQELLSGLKKDDEVITSAGIYGRIVSLDEKVATIEIADRVKVRMLRDRIAGKATAGTEVVSK